MDTRYWKDRLSLCFDRHMRLTRAYSGAINNRSESDNGRYVPFVEKATRDSKTFASFRRNPIYREILEHVDESTGNAYLKIILERRTIKIDDIRECQANDTIGDPFVYRYADIGLISPTTLRYIKVASDLRELFGSEIGPQIAEIGVGYGGQCRVLDGLSQLRHYHLFDLPPVLELASKYLESFLMRGSYLKQTLNQFTGTPSFDLVISNYAFSELPVPLQEAYIEKVIKRSKKGYLTMNSGRSHLMSSNDRISKLTLERLVELLPRFEILEEEPLTGANNYIIVWGR